MSVCGNGVDPERDRPHFALVFLHSLVILSFMSVVSKEVAPSPFAVIAALIGVQLCFGSNYVVSKVVVSHFPPLVWAGIRIAISTVVMFAVCLSSGRPCPKLDREFLLPMIGLALMGTILNQASFLVGLSLTTSANSAVLNTLIPIFTLAIVTLRGLEVFNWKKGAGFILAMVGVLVLRKIEDIRFSDSTFIGDLLIVFNCLIYASFLSFSKKFLMKHDSLWVTAFLFLYGTIGINIIAIPSWMNFAAPVMDTHLISIAAFAIVFGTLAPYFLNFWALKHAKASQVALFIYLQPIIAAAIAYLWLGDTITVRVVVSSTFIFAGLLVALSGSYQGKKRAPIL